MADLSVFVDESGEASDPDTPFYLITLVFHEQDRSIKDALNHYEQRNKNRNLPDIPFHASPLRFGSGPYQAINSEDRKALLVSFTVFVRNLPISYRTFSCEKAGTVSPHRIERSLRRQLATFLIEHIDYFQSFNNIKIYYDGGKKW